MGWPPNYQKPNPVGQVGSNYASAKTQRSRSVSANRVVPREGTREEGKQKKPSPIVMIREDGWAKKPVKRFFQANKVMHPEIDNTG